MLILTRKLGESICLDGNIEVVVTAIRGHQVSLGIAAPQEVTVRRSELLPAECKQGLVPAPRETCCRDSLFHNTRVRRRID